MTRLKQTKTVEETICDVCGASGAYRQCKCCGRDVCDTCHYELFYKKPKPKEERPFGSSYYPLMPPIPYSCEHSYLDSFCRQCYENFCQIIKTLKNPVEVVEIIKTLSKQKAFKCPECGTVIPIEGPEWPSQIVCPNPQCKMVFGRG